jgi:FtsP/CotA-like multicopper oxidase with cupredoxin domain
MNRREFLSTLGMVTAAGAQSPPQAKADFTLGIGPVRVELAPKKIARTIGYNGTSPGPILRMPEGKPVTIDVVNGTHDPEIVHWHGLHIPCAVDGSMEEGTPMVAPGATGRYSFIPEPAGTRWYQTHVSAGRNLKRGLYTGQFGFIYIEPKNEAGKYDKEVFLALREWDPYITTGSDDEASMDAAWKLFSINDKALGAGEPVRVANGQRVLLRILNASATMHRRIAFAGHKFQVVALDGNPVSDPATVEALELGPAERIDALVEMRNPGVWILGATDDHDRRAGMGIVFEYANQAGGPQWLPPSLVPWDYTVFGKPRGETLPAERLPLVFEKIFAGHRWVDKWSINGKSYPKTDPIPVRANGRYRLVFDNRSDEAHPVHLHRHTFELTKVEGVATSGVFKDVVVVRPKTQVEVDLVANNPGLSLFHCHQQMHMDYGFMAMMQYI